MRQGAADTWEFLNPRNWGRRPADQ
jgi:hypothetical protein